MLQDEQLFPLAEAVQRATGRRPHLSTCLRWATRGASGVRLETTMLGGRRLTSREAVVRFSQAVTSAKSPSVPVQPMLTPTQRQRAADRYEQQLREEVGLPPKQMA